MCCDICPRYEECDEKNKLRDNCCSQCPEHDYCIGADKYGETAETETDSENPPSEE
jgi:hypothetical protein